MKNIKNIRTTAFLIFILIISNLTAFAGEIGNANHTDIITYINGNIIPSYNFRDIQLVFTNDLSGYGFSVKRHEKSKSIIITRDLQSKLSPVKEAKSKSGEKFAAVQSDESTVFVGNRKIQSYDIGGYNAIDVGDLSVFGECIWNNSERTLKLILNDQMTYDNGLNLTLTATNVINENSEDIPAVNLISYYYNEETKEFSELPERITNEYSQNMINEKESAALINTSKDAPLYWLGTAIKSMETKSRTIENPLFEYDEAYLLGENVNKITNIHIWEAETKKESLAKELKENNDIPIAIKANYIAIGINGEKNACVSVKNLTDAPITGFNLSIRCYDWNGKGVKYNKTGKTTFSGLMKDDIIYPGEEKDYYWTLIGYDSTTHIRDIKVISTEKWYPGS